MDEQAHASAGRDGGGGLRGLMLGVKDNFCTRSLRTTAGSRILDSHVPLYDAEVVARARAAGAVVLGKCGMDEFGMGSTGAHSPWPPARNVWAAAHAAGGSSSGSAAAVASLCVGAALGSDTGGSVRLPAAYSGLVGVKPSYGLLSRRGLVAYASSLDCPAVLARHVPDAALLLQALAAHDPLDPTAVPAAARTSMPPLDAAALAAQKPGAVRGLRVGLPREYHVRELSEAARAAWAMAARWLQEQGAVLQHVSLPHTAFALPAYYIIASAEASSNLARYDGVRYGLRAQPAGAAAAAGLGSTEALMRASRSAGLGREVQRRVLVGTLVLSRAAYDSFYVQAQAVRRLVARDWAAVFAAGCDVLLTPAAVGAAPLLDAAAEPTREYASDVMTIAASLAGLPAAVLPVHTHTHAGQARLPLGVQLVAPRLHEHTLLRAARALELAAAPTLAPHFSRLHTALLE